PSFPKSSDFVERWRASVRMQRPVLEECTDEGRFGRARGVGQSLCVCRALCRMDLGAGDGPMEVSYPPPFALKLSIDTSGKPTRCEVPRVQVEHACAPFDSQVSQLEAGLLESIDPLPSTALRERWLIR